jgi:hypothetical protein
MEESHPYYAHKDLLKNIFILKTCFIIDLKHYSEY